jgi:hypothetical protein
VSEWPEHRDDVWVDVTSFGPEPVFVRGRSGAAAAVSLARAKYVEGAIEHDEFERLVGEALGLDVSPGVRQTARCETAPVAARTPKRTDFFRPPT